MTGEPPNRPEHGDPEILPRGTIVRPSAERLPFGPSGELLPDGPKLPADYLQTPDLIEVFDWVRKRGDEWTDATFRAEILTYISTFFTMHSWVRIWQVVERVAHSRPGALRNPILIFRFTDDTDVTHEVAQDFPEDERIGSSLAARLLQVTISMEALHPLNLITGWNDLRIWDDGDTWQDNPP